MKLHMLDHVIDVKQLVRFCLFCGYLREVRGKSCQHLQHVTASLWRASSKGNAGKMVKVTNYGNGTWSFNTVLIQFNPITLRSILISPPPKKQFICICSISIWTTPAVPVTDLLQYGQYLCTETLLFSQHAGLFIPSPQFPSLPGSWHLVWFFLLGSQLWLMMLQDVRLAEHSVPSWCLQQNGRQTLKCNCSIVMAFTIPRYCLSRPWFGLSLFVHFTVCIVSCIITLMLHTLWMWFLLNAKLGHMPVH